MPAKAKKRKTKAEAEVIARPLSGRPGRKAALRQTSQTGTPDCGRTLLYTPCMRCQCPLTSFLTDTVHRFLCVRCHAYLAENRRQRAKACTCAKVSECAICKRREHIWRWRQKNKEHIAQWSKEYTKWRREHLKQLEAKKNGRAKATGA